MTEEFNKYIKHKSEYMPGRIISDQFNNLSDIPATPASKIAVVYSGNDAYLKDDSQNVKKLLNNNSFIKKTKSDYSVPSTAINALPSANYTVRGFNVITDDGLGTTFFIPFTPKTGNSRSAVVTWANSFFTSKMLIGSILKFNTIELINESTTSNVSVSFASGSNTSTQQRGTLIVSNSDNDLYIDSVDYGLPLVTCNTYDVNGRLSVKSVVKDNDVIQSTFTYLSDGRINYWIVVNKLETRTYTVVYDTANPQQINEILVS